MPKFTTNEKTQIRNIITHLSIKRMPDPEIIKEIYQQTDKTIKISAGNYCVITIYGLWIKVSCQMYKYVIKSSLY